ncbi:DUF1801 domain-containing protein [Geothrix sp. 21YS21S-4]|uniref:DUF1801 domain-containing protein n=1 Tax=Geothrix sp. 21YS21S-4 TaxID=3068889 RepID=UPI0027BA9509|nr:DUF1801 domain-containing protein [Geothrix sp. 21YS21S-4]
MSTLKHPFKPGIEGIRRIILGADPAISEGIKWNAPPFRTGNHFATLNLRAKDGMGIMLHFGAKVQAGLPERSEIEDPANLLT